MNSVKNNVFGWFEYLHISNIIPRIVGFTGQVVLSVLNKPRITTSSRSKALENSISIAIEHDIEKQKKHEWLLQELQVHQNSLKLEGVSEVKYQYSDGRQRRYLICKDDKGVVKAKRIRDEGSLAEQKGDSTKGVINKIGFGAARTVYKINVYTAKSGSLIKKKHGALLLQNHGVEIKFPPKDKEIKDKLKQLGLTPKGMALRQIYGDMLLADLYPTDLFTYYQENGCFTLDAVSYLMPDLLEAMVQMQKIEYLHLDISAENVLLRVDSKKCLKAAFCDFDGEFGSMSKFLGKDNYTSIQDYYLDRTENNYTFLDCHKQFDISALGFLMFDMVCLDCERINKQKRIDLKKYVIYAQAEMEKKRVPKVLCNLILDMLNPDYSLRPDAKAVQERFANMPWPWGCR